MSAAPVEPPLDSSAPTSLTAVADRLMEHFPGHRVEIIGGTILVTPPPDGPHGDALSELMVPFLNAGLLGEQTRVIQGIGLWLPDGPEDYAIPDFSVVDADYRDHLVENGCYDPAVFRLALEVTSSNYQQDLRVKVAAYAMAKIPVYVILDRKHQRLHVLTDPVANEYDTHRVHAPGELVTLPESIGAKVTLDVTALLKAGQPRT
ncbi:Uma2 family endonuclease [Streptomyces sp. E11-3]|uniref:Uma2 family endonuclease n=1 Tax=Streptomyces sp. E11-3 TaxID=3110112 RepID=UPI0039811A2E